MDFTLSPVLDNLDFLGRGIVITLLVSGFAVVISLILGFIIGLLRCYGPGALRIVLVFYIDSMRAIPLLVVIVWTFFAFPILFGVTMTPMVAAVGAISVHVAAYAAEVVRAGIESIRQGQSIRMMPSFGSIIIITIKDSAIASVIAVPDIVRQAETVSAQTFRPFEVYTFTLLVFFVILFPIARGVDRLYRMLAHRGRS